MHSPKQLEPWFQLFVRMHFLPRSGGWWADRRSQAAHPIRVHLCQDALHFARLQHILCRQGFPQLAHGDVTGSKDKARPAAGPRQLTSACSPASPDTVTRKRSESFTECGGT